MGFLKSSPPSAQPDAKAEAEDIDFMDEDLEEEPAETAADVLTGYDGPRSWEEVEENESQRVSLSISSHAVPSNDSGEAAARLAWQAAALEAENQDPLGLGRIDAHGLRLVSVFGQAYPFCLIAFYKPHPLMKNPKVLRNMPGSRLQVRQDRSSARTGGNRRNVSLERHWAISLVTCFLALLCIKPGCACIGQPPKKGRKLETRDQRCSR